MTDDEYDYQPVTPELAEARARMLAELNVKLFEPEISKASIDKFVEKQKQNARTEFALAKQIMPRVLIVATRIPKSAGFVIPSEFAQQRFVFKVGFKHRDKAEKQRMFTWIRAFAEELYAAAVIVVTEMWMIREELPGDATRDPAYLEQLRKRHANKDLEFEIGREEAAGVTVISPFVDPQNHGYIASIKRPAKARPYLEKWHKTHGEGNLYSLIPRMRQPGELN